MRKRTTDLMQETQKRQERLTSMFGPNGTDGVRILLGPLAAPKGSACRRSLVCLGIVAYGKVSALN